MYKTLSKIFKTFLTDAQIYKYLFNLSPMYRRSTGKIIEVSEDLMYVKIKIPLSIKNKNYVGSIFGGSLFSATDPIYMIQLMHILGDHYIVWDKDATIKYKRPAKENVYAEFSFSSEEIETIKAQVAKKGELNLIKTAHIVNKERVVFAEVIKTIYVADKPFYKKKRSLKTNQK
ncbi:YiiD C-terminal domain-containing protein [Flavivirga jejuensis]|uniref:YiiD C-terminal domain-containing protein n=2 Tax=Flavivirga jejuensis TaxID=870487 RepID=A0ABT8WHE8_9FLAO|nr:DUF4442 domain-containing protein [Flavivirga jejuensis]MDO5972591.1 YiiD C-terminal domain-containing protein [Flavivirga jejuensis]